MSPLVDFASELGFPAIAATTAGFLYWVTSAAEKLARPEALRDIAVVLKSSSWSRSLRPASIVEQLFTWTFGPKHLSAKCIMRSAMCTILMVTALLIFHLFLTGSPSVDGDWPFLLRMAPFASFLADYAALFKTRLLLKIIPGVPSLFLLVFDVLISMLISYISLFMTLPEAVFGYTGNQLRIVGTLSSSLAHIELMNPLYEFQMLEAPPLDNDTILLCFPVFYFSTLFTSVWLVLVVVSSAILKVLAPVHRITAWFFDVEKHPLQAIGIVAGILIMLGAAMLTIIHQL